MIGQTISHYKITAKLGEGGMGVVYKAEDTKLERAVALKFLAAHLLKDQEARKRFEREAKAAAALHHPNVCPVYEIGEADGSTFLAMAFIEGESLDQRIAQGPLEILEALDITQQIAKGIEAAHEKGIVHRDIKPANVIVDSKEHVTVMDFGLALLTEGSKLTQLETRLGTVAYMSPEQAEGAEVDSRTDIWALGCVLYEMVCGQRPFKGQYDQALLYEIINQEQEPLTGLRAGVPMELELLVGKSLAKESNRRYQSAAEMVVDLERVSDKHKSGRSTIVRGPFGTGATTSSPAVTTETPDSPLIRFRVIESLEEPDDSIQYLAEDTELHRSVAIRILPQSTAKRIERARRRKQTLAMGIGVFGVLVGLAFAFNSLFAPHPLAETPLRRFALPVQGPPVVGVAISPDGRHIAYTTQAFPSNTLWIWDLDRLEPRMIESAGSASNPFWSPDSNFVAFRNLGTNDLSKVSVHGGPASTLCANCYTTQRYPSGSWSPDGVSIVFSTVPAGGGPLQLHEVSAQGGTAKPLLNLAEPRIQLYPHFAPIGGSNRVLLFEQRSQGDEEVVVADLTSGRQEVLAPGSRPVYSPSDHVLYQIETAVWALPFSTGTLRPTGEPFPVLGSGLSPSVSRDGTLVYLHPDQTGLQQLIWRDRRGQKMGTIGVPQPRISFPVLSPDGSQVVVVGTESDNADIWIHETARSLKRRLTFDPEFQDRPIWTPQGDKVSFSSPRNASQDVFLKPADGSGESELLIGEPDGEFGFDWSKDGRYLVGSGGGKLWYLRAQAGGGYEKVLFLDAPFDAVAPNLSPNAKFVAYTSNESGRYEVYVQPFPEGGAKWQVSHNGGRQPRWRDDGNEIFYVEGDTLMVVSTTSGSTFSAGNAEPLFSHETAFVGRGQTYDVTPDGQRFVTVETIEETGPGQAIHVVQNWFEEFRDREQD